MINEIDFLNWLAKNGVSKKMQSDFRSRIIRFERATDLSIDEEFHKDKGSFVLSLFDNKGENERMKKINPSDLPIGKYNLATIKLALRKYFDFRLATD